MKTIAKICGAAALAAVLIAPPVLAREGGGMRGGGAGFSGGGGKIGGGMGGGGFNRGGGGPGGMSRAPRFDGGSISRGPRVGNFDRGPRNFGNWNGGKKYGNWNGNWNGPRHHHRHRGGLRFYSYGAPYFYDDYYDYGYAAWDDGDSCQYYWRKWQQTGRSIWRARYYNCIG